MSADPLVHLTPLEYLALERASEIKSEYLDGEMFAMTGASREHNLVVTNVLSELRTRLKGRSCEVYPSDMRVKVNATGLYTYPDVVAVCGEPRFEEDQTPDTLLNPVLLIEVLSPSTEAIDRGRKFEHYRAIPSLREVMFVAQHEPLVEHYLRQEGERWLLTAVQGLDGTVELPTLQVSLPLAEIYERVLPPAGS